MSHTAVVGGSQPASHPAEPDPQLAGTRAAVVNKASHWGPDTGLVPVDCSNLDLFARSVHPIVAVEKGRSSPTADQQASRACRCRQRHIRPAFARHGHAPAEPDAPSAAD